MNKFIISTDSSADLYKSILQQNNVHCIIMKRVLKGKEFAELFDSSKEFDSFYETLKKGDLPTTVALNPFELQEYFEKILRTETTGDIIHIPLSSGLSLTCENAKKAANEVNKNLKDRKVFVIDSLLATCGMGQLVDELILLRDNGTGTQDAIKRVEQLRDRQQTWLFVSDLFQLKRGGRISGAKATIGTILNIKPIIIVSKQGKLAIENKMRGTQAAINYIIGKMEDSAKVVTGFEESTIYLTRTSQSKNYDEFKATIKKRFPQITVNESIIGPIIGTHVGCGAAAIIFEGLPRLDIS